MSSMALQENYGVNSLQPCVKLKRKEYMKKQKILYATDKAVEWATKIVIKKYKWDLIELAKY